MCTEGVSKASEKWKRGSTACRSVKEKKLNHLLVQINYVLSAAGRFASQNQYSLDKKNPDKKFIDFLPFVVNIVVFKIIYVNFFGVRRGRRMKMRFPGCGHLILFSYFPVKKRRIS